MYIKLFVIYDVYKALKGHIFGVYKALKGHISSVYKNVQMDHKAALTQVDFIAQSLLCLQLLLINKTEKFLRNWLIESWGHRCIDGKHSQKLFDRNLGT